MTKQYADFLNKALTDDINLKRVKARKVMIKALGYEGKQLP